MFILYKFFRNGRFPLIAVFILNNVFRYAEDLDFENPDRQKQFQKSVEAAVEQKQAEDEKKKN